MTDNRGGRIFSSPLARRLAREAGLALATIGGSGPGGRIVRRDVERAALNTAAATAAYVDMPHTRMRRAVAARLTDSSRDVPHLVLHGTARVDKLLRLRAHLNNFGNQYEGESGQPEGFRVSVDDLLVRAAARAHVLVPAMNVIWTPDAVRSFSAVDIAVGVSTDQGLVTPVLRNVDTMTISALAAVSSDLLGRARSGRLRQNELEGGTLTVTNLGMLGAESFEAIITPPRSAVLAVGAAMQKPFVSKGRLRVGTLISLTLSVDHRPVDGAVAAAWMATFVSLLEEPVQILL